MIGKVIRLTGLALTLTRYADYVHICTAAHHLQDRSHGGYHGNVTMVNKCTPAHTELTFCCDLSLSLSLLPPPSLSLSPSLLPSLSVCLSLSPSFPPSLPLSLCLSLPPTHCSFKLIGSQELIILHPDSGNGAVLGAQVQGHVGPARALRLWNSSHQRAKAKN